VIDNLQGFFTRFKSLNVGSNQQLDELVDTARTVREVLKATRGLTRLAKTLKMVGADPTDGYSLPKGNSREIELFSSAELHQLFSDPVTGDIWRFLAQTGLRLEEFCWLTKKDVVLDVNGRPIAIQIRHKTCAATGVRWWPKHKIERLIPLKPVTAAILSNAMASATGPWAFEAPATDRNRPGKWPGVRLRFFLGSLNSVASSTGHRTLPPYLRILLGQHGADAGDAAAAFSGSQQSRKYHALLAYQQ